MSSHATSYKLNVKFLGLLVLGTVVLCVAVHFLHRYQEGRLKDRYLTQANQARDEKSPKEVDYLAQYIALVPTDNEARIRFGQGLARLGTSGESVLQGYFTLQKAMQNDPNVPDSIRLQCARLALRIGKPSEARRDLEILIKNDADNLEYAALYTEALARTNDLAGAEAYLNSIIVRQKGYVDGYYQLANLKRDRNRTQGDAADIVMQQMMQYPDNRNNYKAYLRQGQYHVRWDKGAKADGVLAKAKELAPDNPEVLQTLALRKLIAWRQQFPTGDTPKTTPEFEEGVAMLDRALKNLGPLPPTEPLPEYGTKEFRTLDQAAFLTRTIAQAYTTAGRFDVAETYAREQVKRFPKTLVLHTELLDVLVRKQQYAEAEKMCTAMENAGVAPAYCELQRGFMAAQQKRWIDASRHIERTLGEIASDPDQARRANIILAICYEKTGELQRVYECLRKAIPPDTTNPEWIRTKVSLAETMARLGLHQNAIREYKDVIDREPRVAYPLVSLLTMEAAKANTPALQEDIKKYTLQLKDGPAKDIQMARQMRVKGDAAGGRALLEKSLTTNPDVPALYLELFDFDIQDRNYDAAAAIIAKAQAKFGDTFDTRMMRVSLIGMKGDPKPDVIADLESLTKNIDKFPDDQKVRLVKSCSFAARALGRRDLALDWLNKVSQIQGDSDIDTHYQRFDLAVLDNDPTRLEKVMADIARVSGGTDNPTYRLAQAFALIHQADRVRSDPAQATPLLEKASELLSLLERDRKEWGRLNLAQAKVADMLAKRDVATAKYKKAIENGERAPEVFRRLADLYALANNTEAIGTLIAAYPEAAGYLGNQKKKLVAVMLNNKEFAKALETARAAVPPESKDVAELLWLAMVENAAKQPVAAEATLKKAHMLKPDEPDIWLVYVNTLATAKKTVEARTFIEERKGMLKPEDAPLVLAQAYALVQDQAKARELFLKLVETKGDSLPVLKTASDFFFSTQDYLTASRLLEKILATTNIAPDVAVAARRMLALCTVANNDHISAVRALGILGFKTADAAAVFSAQDTLEDLRCRFAVLKSVRGRAARMAAAVVLRELEARMGSAFTTDLNLAFAQVQYALGDWADANRRLKMAASGSDGGPGAAAIYASALLRKNDLEEAAKWIQQLTIREPDSQRTMELAAKLAALQDRKVEAVELVRRWVAKANPAEMGAAILEQLGLFEDAEAYYKQAAADTKTGQAERQLLYAGYLARAGKPAEALAQFEQAWDLVPAEKVVPMLAVALISIDANTAPAVVQKMVARVEAETRKNARLTPILAAVYSLIDRVPEALVMSQTVLQSDPNNVFTMNNLAFLLALKDGKYDEADAMIRRAVAIVGPQPTLLDTQATIAIAAGRSKDAIELCKEVLVDEPSASVYVHLAQAYLADGKVSEAKMALEEARKLNLRINEFHPLERPRLASVIALLEKK